MRDVAVAITGSPATVNGYVARLHPATLYLALAYIVGIALVVRASLVRRLAMLAHAVLYVALSLLVQALMITIGVTTRWLVAPFGIEATLANLLIGGLVVMRLTFVSFALPRATTVRVTRRRWPWDSVVVCCALMSAMALLVVAYAFLSEPSNLSTAWQVFVPLYAVCLLLALMLIPLWLLWWSRRRLPEPDDRRPAVDVIIPAYNEEENIARLLRSVDVAAGRYGGPVRVVVSNDGSADRTEQIAAAAVAKLRHAHGSVLTWPNGGQSAALNRALAITEAEICVRIDADCVMGQDALAYSVPWFRDRDVGMVGAMQEPRQDTVTWFHRLRALETLFQFQFARLGQSLVDGVVVIPGTFTVFRRAPAAAAGGFPTGMNGEDTDLTMQFGRLGYRSVIDPRIRCFEDVPRHAGEFVEQRTRWARAGFHVYARHVPLRSGLGRPAGVVLDDAPGILLVLPAGGRGGPDLHAGTRPDSSRLPAERRDLRPAICRGWRTARAGQRAVCDQVRALAQPAVGSRLVCLCVPSPHGHAGGGHHASGPALPGERPGAGGAAYRAGPAGRPRRPRGAGAAGFLAARGESRARR